MVRRLAIVLGFLLLLGLALIIWSSAGDASVMASTGHIHQALTSHGLGDDAPLRGELFQGVLQLRWLWSVVRVLGAGVLLTSCVGLVMIWRARRDHPVGR